MAKQDSKVTTIDDGSTASTAATVDAAVVVATNHDAALSGRKRILTVHQSDGDGGNDAVFIQINGYAYQIPRGKPVEVPEEVIEVLNNAKQTSVHFGQGGSLTETTKPRFAFSIN